MENAMSSTPPHLRQGPVSLSGSGSGQSAANASESGCHPDEEAAAAGAAEVYGVYEDGAGPSSSGSGAGDDAAGGSLSGCE